MKTEIRSSVRKFVGESFLFREEIGTFGDEDSFLAAGIIDSTGVLELVFFLENTFGIQVADEEMLPENLDSVAAITEYISRKVTGQRLPAIDVAQ